MKERPTIRDVAARAGVSVATVSYVMNDKGGVGSGTRERVRAVAAALGYAPDAAARSLATRLEHPDAPPAKELLPVELVVRASSGEHVA
jgi:transcriptional regulator with XRE-family HTH domain